MIYIDAEVTIGAELIDIVIQESWLASTYQLIPLLDHNGNPVLDSNGDPIMTRVPV
jgi:hypothetical protein